MTVTQMVNKLTACYGTWTLITVLTKAHQKTLC